MVSSRRALAIGVFAAGLVAASLPAGGCQAVDLATQAQIVDVQSGYYDMGLVNGKTKLVPNVTVRIRNAGADTLNGFQISASFWRTGEDGQRDELQLPHLVAKGLAPGATSDPVLLRANFGYTLDGARADFFTNSGFADFTIKVFGKVGGKIAKLGEFTIARKILAKDATAPTT